MGGNSGWPGSAAASSRHDSYGAPQAAASSSSSSSSPYDTFAASLPGGPQHFAPHPAQEGWRGPQHDSQYAPHLMSTASMPGSSSMPLARPNSSHQVPRDHHYPSSFHDYHDSIAGPSTSIVWSHSQQGFQRQHSHSHDMGSSFVPPRSSPHYGSGLSMDSMPAYRMGVTPQQHEDAGSASAPPSATMSSHSVMTSLPTSFAPPLIQSPATYESSIPNLNLASLPASVDHGAPPLLRRPSTATASHFMDDGGSSSAGTTTTNSFNPSPTSQTEMRFPPTDAYSHQHSYSHSHPQSLSIASSSSSVPHHHAILSPITTTAMSPHNAVNDQHRADEILKRLRSRASDSKEGVAACDYCRKRKIRCDRVKPTCGKCLSLGKQCATTDTLRKRGPPSKKEKELLAAQGLHFIPSRVRRKSVNNDEAAMMAAAAHGHGRPHANSLSSTSSSSVSTMGSGTAGSSSAAEKWLGPSPSTSSAKKKGRASHGNLKSVKQESGGGGAMARLSAAASSPELHSIMVGLSSAASPLQRLRAKTSSEPRRSLDVTGISAGMTARGHGHGDEHQGSGRSVSARASPSGMTAATAGRRQSRPSLGTVRREQDGHGRAAGPSRTYSDPSAVVRQQQHQSATSEQGEMIAAMLAADMQSSGTEAKGLVRLQHQHGPDQLPSDQPQRPSGAHLLFYGSGGTAGGEAFSNFSH